MGIEERKWSPLGKKHNWTSRSGGEIEYELNVYEYNRKIDKFRWNTKSEFKRILELLRLKFGLDYQ